MVEVGVHRVVEVPEHRRRPKAFRRTVQLSYSCLGVLLGDRILEVGPEIFDREPDCSLDCWTATCVDRWVTFVDGNVM